MDDILTQAEVDSLFTDDAPAEEAARDEPAETVRKYDLGNQERIVRGRMPTLEIINERFGRNVRVALFNFMHRTPELSIGPVRVLKYSAFLRELILPTNLNIVQLKSLRGSSLFVFEPTLVFGVIETMFGGSGKVHTRIEGRDFTVTEQRIIHRMLEIVLAEYSKAWQPTYDLRLEFMRSEMQPQFVSIATPSEVVVATKFELDLGHSQGAIHVCIPYASLEPIRDVLISTVQTDVGDADNRWVGMLQHQVQTAEVEMIATLTTIRATLKQLLNMKPGDVLSIDMPELVSAAVDGIPLFECRAGTSHGKFALRVENVLNHNAEFGQGSSNAG
jgi:flagellar motor switch protein FliM